MEGDLEVLLLITFSCACIHYASRKIGREVAQYLSRIYITRAASLGREFYVLTTTKISAEVYTDLSAINLICPR